MMAPEGKLENPKQEFHIPRPASGHQVNDQDHQCHNKQKVDQTTGNMQAETGMPHDQENRQYRPKRVRSPLRIIDSLDLTLFSGTPAYSMSS